jgi:hypothetical protein
MESRGRIYVWATGEEKKQSEVKTKQCNGGENFLKS